MVWRQRKLELWRYRSDAVRLAPPLLLIPTPTSPSYLMDLRAGNSMVEQMRDAGFDVLLLDWGIPDADDAGDTLATYVDEHLPGAVRAACEVTGSRAITLVGFCVGGIPALLYAAGHADAPVHALVSISTPVDVAEVRAVAVPIRTGAVAVDDLLDETGNVPRKALLDDFGFAPTQQQIWNDFGRDYWALAQWFRERPPLPGAAFREGAELLIRDNALADGAVELGGRRIELAAIRCPVLNVIAERDGNFPVGAIEPLTRLVGSADVEELRVDVSHLALLAGRNAATVTVPAIAGWIERHSERHA